MNDTIQAQFLREFKELLAKYKADFIMESNAKCLGAEIPVIQFKGEKSMKLPKFIYSEACYASFKTENRRMP